MSTLEMDMKSLIQKCRFSLLALGLMVPVGVSAQPGEMDWPREFKSEQGVRLLMYAPQVESWDKFNKIVTRVAIALAKDTKDAPMLGSFQAVADTSVDQANRMVLVKQIQITAAHFPSLDTAHTRALIRDIKRTIPREEIVISLDRILASLKQNQVALKEVSLRNDPPVIFVSDRPALLVHLDGPPIWSPIKGTDLKWAVNTNWPLFLHEPSRKHYLRYEKSWLETADMKGAWSPAGDLPVGFSKLPADDKNWDDERASLPGNRLKSEEMPEVYYSSQPAELIVMKGKPSPEKIKGLFLQWVANTESNLFFYPPTRQFYYLVSGRWFKSSSLNGPWTFCTQDLPEDFQRIPAEHPRARIRASVPGTDEATLAALQAAIPQTARVERKKVTAEAHYSGTPEFKTIAGTSLLYAVNCPESVIKAGDLYYLCFQGVWFVSRNPTGPWEVVSSVPDVIYTIPPSSPVYNVTYVRVYDSSPTYVTFGYTSGYYGAYTTGGCVVYGTGWYYPPVYVAGAVYPVYYPYAYTYGAAVTYNAYTGTYVRGAYAYGPYGGVGYGAAYNPTTGTYTRGAVAYGPNGGNAYGQAYNPRTGAYGQTQQHANAYGHWGSSAVQRGDNWAQSAHAGNSQAGVWGYQTSNGHTGFVVRNGDDLYAGRDGNVYRKSDSGWQKYQNGDWNQMQKPAAGSGFQSRNSANTQTLNQLNRDAASRNLGTQRTQQFNQWRGNGGGNFQRPSGANFQRPGGGNFQRPSFGGFRRR
jgi:hypothetical protein